MIFKYVTLENEIETYQTILPTDNDEITHWYPCIGLRDIGDQCKISKILIE